MTGSERLAVFPQTARVGADGHLLIGGCDVVDLAAEFGTPLYVFDEVTLRAMCREFRREFAARWADCRVIYACKAYINRALAQLFSEEGLGLDVVSGGELAIARSVGFPMAAVYFHGNNKAAAELEAALEAGVGRIVVDNFHELALLNELAGRAGQRQDVLLRLSPGVDPHTHAHTTTGILDSKFGFVMADGQAERAVRQALVAPNLNLIGLHFHLGSPIFELEPYREAVAAVLAFAATMQPLGLELAEFSPGGGFAVQYLVDTPPPPVAAYADTIGSALRAVCAEHGLGAPRLVVEPGRAIVGRAGVAVYTVGAAKDIPGVRRYVSVDGGMADNIRPALYGARYEALAANRATEPHDEPVTIAGKYCESGDVLLRDVRMPPLVAGDLVAVPAAGAYCLAMASNYNASLQPAVAMVADGRARLIRRRQTYDDLLRNDEV